MSKLLQHLIIIKLFRSLIVLKWHRLRIHLYQCRILSLWLPGGGLTPACSQKIVWIFHIVKGSSSVNSSFYHPGCQWRSCLNQMKQTNMLITFWLSGAALFYALYARLLLVQYTPMCVFSAHLHTHSTVQRLGIFKLGLVGLPVIQYVPQRGPRSLWPVFCVSGKKLSLPTGSGSYCHDRRGRWRGSECSTWAAWIQQWIDAKLLIEWILFQRGEKNWLQTEDASALCFYLVCCHLQYKHDRCLWG